MRFFHAVCTSPTLSLVVLQVVGRCVCGVSFALHHSWRGCRLRFCAVDGGLAEGGSDGTGDVWEMVSPSVLTTPAIDSEASGLFLAALALASDGM